MLQKAAFFTLGCKVNQTETEMAEGSFQDAGYEIVDFSEIADVYIINTCTVTSSADRKSRQMIRRAIGHKEAKPNIVIVMGCYAQASSSEILSKLDVDLVIGNTHRAQLMEYLKEYQKNGIKKAYSDSIMNQKEYQESAVIRNITRTRAFVKIQEGCEQFCSYCIIPYTRGPSRSRLVSHVLSEVRELEERGFKEVVLTGIHIGLYGLDFTETYRLSDLLKELLAATKDIRFRISSIEPTEVTEDLIELIAGEQRICDHLHIPLQSGSDLILKNMNRPYDTKYYRASIEKIRQRIPEIAITTDIITGFPGEDDAMAEQTLAFAASIQFSDIHVFSYSPREDTPAAGFPNQVIKKDKDIRSASLIRLASDMKKNYMRGFIGREIDVLFEQDHNGISEGHSSAYLRVRVGQSIPKNEYRRVLVVNMEEEVLTGHIVSQIIDQR